MNALVLRVKQFALRLPLAGTGVVVAVSGGPDSVALLRVLIELAQGCQLSHLVIAHLNHQLRGLESDADETFVRQLHATLVRSSKLNLDLRCEKIDIAERARRDGGNLENTARDVRYGWLAETARATKCRWVATGHNADDQAETVLHRLLRGSGLRGLRGISSRRALHSGIELIRPLIRVTRSEILDYLKGLNQNYRVDATNLDQDFTRNRIRHELLPLLAANYNPSIGRILSNLADQAEELYATEEALTAKTLREAELPRAGPVVVLDRTRLTSASRYSIREVFRLIWTREGWPEGAMNYSAWDQLASLAYGEFTALDLPGGVRAFCRDRVVQVGRVS